MNGLYLQYEVLWKVQYSVFHIVDRNHQRSVIVVDHSRNFKGIQSMVVTIEKYLSRNRKLLFKIEKRKVKK